MSPEKEDFGLPKDFLSGVKSSKLRYFLTNTVGEAKKEINEDLISILSKGDLKSFFIDFSKLQKNGEVTRDKINDLIFNHFSKEEIENFDKDIEKLFLKVSDVQKLLDNVLKDIFDNYKLKDYKELNLVLEKLSEICYLILSNPVYINPYFKEIYDLQQIDKIEIIIHKLERIIYDLYKVENSGDLKKYYSKKADDIATYLWEISEMLEDFIN